MHGLSEVCISPEDSPIARLWSAQLRNNNSITQQIWMAQAQGVYRKTQLKCQLLGEDFLDHPNFHENQGILYSPPSGIPKALRRVRLKMHLCMLSHPVVSNFLQPHGLYHPPTQAPLSMGFSRQEYYTGLPGSPPGDPSNSGIKPMSPALAGGFLTTSTTWEAFWHSPALVSS